MAILNSRYTINGLIDTNQSALDNMTAVVNSCNTWLSYDALVGKWAVVINEAGSSQYSFGDSNIVGAVNLSTTDLENLYNSVEVRFHNTELRDKEDYVVLEIPAGERLPNEPDNRLTINAPLVNNQIQAQLLGLIELKQSRLDKVIQFQTDFSYINIEAGTIISVTNSVYGWTNKLFRVLQLAEQETNGTILIDITAQEYDSDIYDDGDLYLYLREKEDGLIELDPLTDVSAITPSSAVVDGDGNSLLGLLGANALIALIKGMMEDDDTGAGSIFDKVFDLLEQETGSDLRTGAVFVAADVGTLTTTITQSSSTSDYKALGNTTFTAAVTGSYKADVIFDQNSSGAVGGRGNAGGWGENLDYISCKAQMTPTSSPGTIVYQQESGGDGAQYWTDFAMTGIANLTANTSYTLSFTAVNYTESNPGTSANISVGWSVYSVG
jgi:hypothetical protein